MATPTLANAQAIFYAEVAHDLNSLDLGIVAEGWNYQVSDNQASDAKSCIEDGESVVGLFRGEDSILEFGVVSLDPPFSGSSSSTKYLTVCYDTAAYLIVEMTIDLTECVLWVCTLTFSSEVVDSAGSGYSTNQDLTNTLESLGILSIEVPDLSD